MNVSTHNFAQIWLIFGNDTKIFHRQNKVDSIEVEKYSNQGKFKITKPQIK